MNIYVLRRGARRPNSVEVMLMNAEGRIVGKVTNEVADYLLSKGIAMDITEKNRNQGS